MHSRYSTGGSLLRLFSLMTRRSIPRSFAYGLPRASTCISVAFRISPIEPIVLSLCSLVKITAAPISAAMAARSAFMPTESASRSSTTFPAPKNSGTSYPENLPSDSTSPDPAGGTSGSARRHAIPQSYAASRFADRPAFPGTTTAAAPALATASPTSGIFSSWRLSTKSARERAAEMSAGSWVSTASGPSISARDENAADTCSGVASNPNPRSTISAPLLKNSRTMAGRSAALCASMISAKTFILDPPPIFTPLAE